MADDAATDTGAESPESESTAESVEETQEVEAQPSEGAEAEESVESGDDAPEEKKNSFQERISSLTRRAKEAESRAEAAQREAQQAQERVRYFESQIQAVQPTPRPKLEEFEYDEQRHAEALDQWYSENQERSAQSAYLRQQQAAVQLATQQAQKAKAQAFTEKANAYAVEHEDFYPSLQTLQSIGVGPAIQQAAQVSENGPALLYHLSKNPHVAQEINSMHPVQGIMRLAQIESRLSQTVAPKPSQAPAPQRPVGSKAPVGKDPDKMSPEEYVKFREKQRAK